MTKNELIDCLEKEKTLYLGTDKKKERRMRRSCHRRYLMWQALYYFRKAQYYNAVRGDRKENRVARIAAQYLFCYYDRKRNRSGAAAGIEIGLGSSIGVGVDFWHGGIVINGTLGDHCVLHGNNVIGNKGRGRETETPVIGNGVDIGAGAVIIGDVIIAENSTVGAGAVVTHSFMQNGSVLVGVPAKMINHSVSENSEA